MFSLWNLFVFLISLSSFVTKELQSYNCQNSHKPGTEEWVLGAPKMYFKLQPFPSSLDPFGEICAFVFSARDPINQPIMFRELELDIEVDVDTFTVIEYSLLSFWLSKLFCFCFCFWFKNAPEMKGRYEVCGQELKLKDYIKLERNSGYVHTVTDEFWTTGHSVYTKPCESFVLFRWN